MFNHPENSGTYPQNASTLSSSIQRPKHQISARSLLGTETLSKRQGKYLRKLCLKNVTKISVDLKAWRFDEKRWPQRLCPVLRNFKFIANLDITFEPNIEEDKEVFPLLRHLTCLSTLSFSSLPIQPHGDPKIKKILSPGIGLRSSVRIHSLTIDLADNGLSRQNFDSTFMSLKYLPHLSNLIVLFSNRSAVVPGKNDPGCLPFNNRNRGPLARKGPNNIKTLSKSLSSLRNLSVLDLSMCNEHITDDESIRMLSASLSDLTSLSDLSLELGGCRGATDQSLAYLSTSLGHLTSLAKFRLYFNECTSATDEGIRILCEGLKGLRLLSELHLNFHGRIMITDVSIGALSVGLRCLTHLAVANVGLSNCRKRET